MSRPHHVPDRLASEQLMERERNSFSLSHPPMQTGPAQFIQRRIGSAPTLPATAGIPHASNGTLQSRGDQDSNALSEGGQPIAQSPMIARTAQLQVVVAKFDVARSAVESI